MNLPPTLLGYSKTAPELSGDYFPPLFSNVIPQSTDVPGSSGDFVSPMRSESPSAFLECMREATRASHGSLEGLLREQSRFASEKAFVRTLQIFESIWIPCEDYLQASPLADQPELGLQERLRGDRLVDDRARLGGESLPVRAVDEFLGKSDRGTAAGILYVLEGSRFGSRSIREMLRPLGIDQSTGASFFSGEPSELADHWKIFVGWADDNLTQSEVVRAADAASKLFLEFYRAFTEDENR